MSRNPSGPRLACRSWGSVDDTPVLLVHGVQGCGMVWAPVATRLAAQGFHTLALDLRGHGQSGRARSYGLSDHVQDVVDVLSRLDLGPVHLVGHSLGATIAWTLAAQHPDAVRRLVIEDQHPNRQASAPDVFRDWADQWQWAFTSREEAMQFLDSHGHSDAWWTPSLERKPDGTWGWAFDAQSVIDSVRGVASADHWSQLRQVRATSLVIRGRDSEHLSSQTAAKMAAALPRGRLVTLPGDHWVHRDPEPYARAVGHHLTEEA